MAFFSSLAASILCAMYPPPPGSAPGYHTLHHCTAIGIIKRVNNDLLSVKSGKKFSLSATLGCCNKFSKPPTSGKFIM